MLTLLSLRMLFKQVLLGTLEHCAGHVWDWQGLLERESWSQCERELSRVEHPSIRICDFQSTQSIWVCPLSTSVHYVHGFIGVYLWMHQPESVLPAWHCQWCVEEKSRGRETHEELKNKNKTGILQTLSVSVSYWPAKIDDAGRARGRTWLAAHFAHFGEYRLLHHVRKIHENKHTTRGPERETCNFLGITRVILSITFQYKKSSLTHYH